MPNHGLTGLSRSTILDTLLQIQVLVQNFIKCREQFGGLAAEDDVNCELEPLDENARDGVDQFFHRMGFLKKARDATPSLRGLPKRLKWVTF